MCLYLSLPFPVVFPAPDYNRGHYSSLRARKAAFSEVNEGAVQFEWSSRPEEDSTEDENSDKMQNLRELPLPMGLKKAIRYNMFSTFLWVIKWYNEK